MTMARREFLKWTTLATSAAVIEVEQPEVLGIDKTHQPLVDVNVSLGRWPVRRLPGDDPGRLAASLRSRGVTQAWTGSLEGVFHKDLATVNARLVEDCQHHGRGWLIPFGSVNPRQPGWEKVLLTCATVHRLRGLRLHPNYHGYPLDDPAFVRLLKQAAEQGLIVQLALVMEDERMMHPRLRVEPVNITPLPEVVRHTPGLRLVLINALRNLRGEPLRNLVAAGKVSFEIAMLEGVGGVGKLLEQVPADRVLFGSHAPLFYFEAAELKLRESALTPGQLQALRCGNAHRLLS
jgi:uncharacterized protein